MDLKTKMYVTSSTVMEEDIRCFVGFTTAAKSN